MNEKQTPNWIEKALEGTADMAEYRGWVECLRFAAFPAYIQKECHTMGLALEMKVDKGFLRETTYFTVRGSNEKVRDFKKKLKDAIDAIEEYQSK